MLEHPQSDHSYRRGCPLCTEARERRERDRVAPLRAGRVLTSRPGPLPVDAVMHALQKGAVGLRPVGCVVGRDRASLEVPLEAGGTLHLSASRRPEAPDDVEGQLARHPLWRSTRRRVRRWRGQWLVSAELEGPDAIEVQLVFTRVLAALAQAGDALAVAWDDPLHPVPAEEFIRRAGAASRIAPPTELWIRPSVAYDARTDRVDVLSWGMGHLGAPEVSVDAPAARRNEALTRLYRHTEALLVAPSPEGFAIRESPVHPGRGVLSVFL